MSGWYVDVQRKVNSVHKDGSVETLTEEAIDEARGYAKWILSTSLPRESVLDAGCRVGYAMRIFRDHLPNARIAGVDIVPEFVAKAKRRGEAFVGDLQALPFADGEFHWTFCSAAIEHCPSPRKAMSELCRVTKYGVLILTDLEDKPGNLSHFWHHDDPADWVETLRQPDWRLIKLLVPNPHFVRMIWVRTEYAKKIWEPR